MFHAGEGFEGSMLDEGRLLRIHEGHRALLCSVVLQAIADACLRPLRVERQAGRNIVPEARSALAFLFHPDGRLWLYADWLGMSVQQVRARLRRFDPWTHTPHGAHFPECAAQHQDSLQRRLLWFAQEVSSGGYCGPEPESDLDYRGMQRIERASRGKWAEVKGAGTAQGLRGAPLWRDRGLGGSLPLPRSDRAL